MNSLLVLAAIQSGFSFQVLEQYYQSHEGSGDSGSTPGDVSPDQPQRAQAKASNSNNFYFRSQPDIIPTASLDDTRNSKISFHF